MRELLIQAEPEPIKIDSLKTAVIVVDMQNAFLSKGGYFDLAGHDLSDAQKIIRPCKEIINMARGEGSKIIYLQMGCCPDLSDAGNLNSPNRLKSRGLKMAHQHPEWKEKLYIYGTWGAEIIEELKLQPGDILVKKQKYDGFIGTNLDIILRTYDVKYLLFMGIATNICVESTIRHAFFLDYFAILVSDAVSQVGPIPVQEATLFNVRSTFGWVTTSENLLRALRGSRPLTVRRHSPSADSSLGMAALDGGAPTLSPEGRGSKKIPSPRQRHKR
jgi:ureidoacrylate peracid hydrolase